MEFECNQVASGAKRKEDIMVPLLENMRHSYQRVSSEANKLDEAVARRFPKIGSGAATYEIVQRQFSLCGICNSMMSLKRERCSAQNSNGRTNQHVARRNVLLYCETCLQGWGLPERGKVAAKTEGDHGRDPIKCPLCSFQIIQIKRGEGFEGNGYYLCPKCFSDPPITFGGSAGGAGFRCFQCQNQNCALATGTPGGDTEIFPCPFCAQSRLQRSQTPGQVKLRSSPYRLACSNCSGNKERCNYTVWLPKEASKVEIMDLSNCDRCASNGKNVSKIKFTFRSGSVPPAIDTEISVCILCDDQFRQHLSITLPRYNQVTTNAHTRGRGGQESYRGDTRNPDGGNSFRK